VGYWIDTLQALKAQQCPWDQAYYFFRLALKDYKDRWTDFDGTTTIPLPWELEEQTLTYLGQCRALGGQQLKRKQIREGWMLKPKKVPDQQTSLSSLSDASAGTGKTRKEQELLALAKLLKKYGVHCDDSDSDDDSSAYEDTNDRPSKRIKKNSQKKNKKKKKDQKEDGSCDIDVDIDSGKGKGKGKGKGRGKGKGKGGQIRIPANAARLSKQNTDNRTCRQADDECEFLQKHKCCAFYHSSAPPGTTGFWNQLNNETKKYLEELSV
jgi:hypothetical protein